MALTSIPTVTSAAGPQPDLGIYLTHYNGTAELNTIIYTVPEGRKFEGYQSTNSDNYSYGREASVSEQHYGGQSQTPINVILTGGQSFKSGGSQYAYHMLWGVEKDA